MIAKNKILKRTLWFLLLFAVLLVLVMLWIEKPWRKTMLFADNATGFSYLEMLTAQAQSEDRLPMIIALHGVGDAPEFFQGTLQQFPAPVRIILPAGHDNWGWGYSWFQINAEREAISSEIAVTAKELAAFTQALVARYPTQGKPIVTGFSQGGIMTFALAAYYGDYYAGAVPLAGALLLPIEDAPSPAPSLAVRALHGEKDPAVLRAWAHSSVAEMAARGWDITLQTFPNLGHVISDEMKAAWHQRLLEMVRSNAQSHP